MSDMRLIWCLLSGFNLGLLSFPARPQVVRPTALRQTHSTEMEKRRKAGKNRSATATTNFAKYEEKRRLSLSLSLSLSLFYSRARIRRFRHSEKKKREERERERIGEIEKCLLRNPEEAGQAELREKRGEKAGFNFGEEERKKERENTWAMEIELEDGPL